MQENSKWDLYVISDLKTWAMNSEDRSPLETYHTFEEAKARFQELRVMEYNNQVGDVNPDG